MDKKNNSLEIEKQNEISAYKDHMDPHFLYNTLECIRAVAMYHRVDQITEITEALSKCFRYFNKGDCFATINEELSIIIGYLKIIEVRFMGRIRFEIDVDENLLSLRILKMLLQPIVDNAVYHSLERKVGNGCVYININRIRDNRIKYIIQDDGIGMGEQQVKELRAYIMQSVNIISAPSGKIYGSGLQIIYQKLKLHYSDKAEIIISSKSNEGTSVTIITPEA